MVTRNAKGRPSLRRRTPAPVTSTTMNRALVSFCALIAFGCAASPPPAVTPQPPVKTCANAVLHEEFEKELAAARAESTPERRAAAVCRVAHGWGIDDCSNVTARSLPLP